jgi:hypothetical protein
VAGRDELQREACEHGKADDDAQPDQGQARAVPQRWQGLVHEGEPEAAQHGSTHSAGGADEPGIEPQDRRARRRQRTAEDGDADHAKDQAARDKAG